MLERICDCICHPKRIGKYYKDKFWIVLGMLVLFFGCYAGVSAARYYTTPAFTDNSVTALVSSIIRGHASEVKYDSSLHMMTGKSCTYEGEKFRIVFLPTEGAVIETQIDDVNIIFYSEDAKVYYGKILAGQISYETMMVSGFSINGIQGNQVDDILNFKTLTKSILDNASVFFQTISYVSNLGTTLFYYLIIVFLMTIFTSLLNPTIDRKVRIKLCFYDGLIFFICCFFAMLFNVDMIIYISFLFPIIFSNITFRHILKVPGNK